MSSIDIDSSGIIISGGTFDATANTTYNGGVFTHTAGGTFNHNDGTFVADGGTSTYDFDSTETFYAFTNSKNNTQAVTVASGDTLIVTDALIMTDGRFNTGNVEARADVTVGVSWDGGGSPFYFRNSTVDQTFDLTGATDRFDLPTTINKSSGIVEVVSAFDLDDSSTFILTSGTFDMNGNAFTVTNVVDHDGGTLITGAGAVNVTGYNIAGGAFTGTSASSIDIGSSGIVISGGTFDATANTTYNGGVFTHTAGGTFNHNNGTFVADGNTATYDFDSTETFYAFTNNKSNTQAVTIASGDTLIVADALILTNGRFNTGDLESRGDITMGASWDSGTSPFYLRNSTADQTIDFSADTDLFEANITINKSSGSVIMDSIVDLDASGQDLLIEEGTLDLNGNNLIVNNASGTLIVETGGNLQLQGGETITATGSYPQLDSGSTVTYDGTGGDFTLKDYTYHHLTIAGETGRLFTLAATETIGGNLTITSGTLDLGGNGLTVTGTFSNEDNLTLRGDESTSLTMDTDSGTVEFVGNGDASADTYTVSDLATTFNHLTIDSADGDTDIYQLGAAIDVNTDFTVEAGTFDVTATDYGLTVGGGFSVTGTFTAQEGTVTFDDASKTTDISGSHTFYNFRCVTASKAINFQAGQTQTVGGTLTLTGASSQLITLRSSSAETAWNLTVSGSTSIDYVDVQDSDASGGNEIEPGDNSTDSLRNTNWAFNDAPTVASVSATVATDGTGEVTVQFTMDDADDDDTLEALIEYSTDGGSGWSKATISEVVEDTTATYGTPDVENDDTYQVGNAGGYITSSSGANTITVIWDSMTDASTSDESDIQVRVTPYDATEAGSVSGTTNFTLDNVVPASLASFATGTVTASTIPLTWTAATDTNFNHYEIWYSTTQSNAQNRNGDAVEWDDSDDANLTTATTAATTITGLTEDLVYYVKIWAIDDFGNLTTLSDITADTNTAPLSLASLDTGTMTATTAPLTWTAAADGNFNHYEIWYGTTLVDVQNRTGTATEWDDSDDANLATAGTTATTITGLTEDLIYYTKIWAIDDNANETTIAYISADTNTAPIGLASFAGGVTTSSTIAWTWTAASDPNFDIYEIWYGTNQSDVENRTGTADTWDDEDDSNLATAGTTTTTITGLSEDTTYYAKIWAVDVNENESTVSTATANNNGRPTLASLTATQATDGTGEMTVSFILDDSDNDNTLQALIEYSLNGSTWSKATISEEITDLTATYGTPDVENDNTYQVGNATGYVTSSSGANTITTIWNSQTDVPTTDTSTAQVRVTPYDGTEPGAVLTSSANILIDNVAPTGMADLTKSTATATEMTLTWTASTETNFDHYEIWYGTTQADVQGRTGTATEWDNDDDSDLATLATATTAITGLEEGVTYYFKIFAIDSYLNEANLTDVTAATNNLPTVTSVTPTAATDGTGNVTVVIVTNDADTEGVELLVEYSLDGSTWAEATINEDSTNFSVENGTVPTVENDNTRQIGASGARIDTTGGANTMTVLWPSVTDAATADASTIQLRATSYDGIESGTATASDAFTLDNVVPAWTSNLTLQTEDVTGLILSWTAGTDTNFSHYEAWYGTNMTEVVTRGAGATEWDNDDDIDLATAATSTSTISFTVVNGQTYSVGVWMVDTYGNESGPIEASVRRGPSTVQIDETTGNTLTFGGGGSGEDGYVPDFVDITPDEEIVTEEVVVVIEEEIVEDEVIEDVEEEIVEEEVEEEIEETEELEEETLEEEVAEEAEELEEWIDDSVEELEEWDDDDGRTGTTVTITLPETATLDEVVDVVDEIIPDDQDWSATSLKDFGTLDVVQTIYNNSNDLNVLIFDFFFAPTEAMTRFELLQLTMHISVADLFEGELDLDGFEFVDVDDESDYVAYFAEATLRGIVSGYDDGTFRPEEDATRAEALKILLRSNEITFVDNPSQGILEQFELEENPFTDVDLDEWYAPYVLYAYANGYVHGYGDGTFRPEQKISRAEYSAMVSAFYSVQ